MTKALTYMFTCDGIAREGRIAARQGDLLIIEGLAQDSGTHFLRVGDVMREFPTWQEIEAYVVELAQDAVVPQSQFGKEKGLSLEEGQKLYRQLMARARGKPDQEHSGFSKRDLEGMDAPSSFHDFEHGHQLKPGEKEPNTNAGRQGPGKTSFRDFEHGHQLKPGEKEKGIHYGRPGAKDGPFGGLGAGNSTLRGLSLLSSAGSGGSGGPGSTSKLERYAAKLYYNDGTNFGAGRWDDAPPDVRARYIAQAKSAGAKDARVLPSEWGKRGYYALGSGPTPKVGDYVDYYDSNGEKQYGLVSRYDGSTITIGGRRMHVVRAD